MNDGLIDLSQVPYIPTWKIIERDIEKYKWEDTKEYYKSRLAYIYRELTNNYDIELAREKQALYLINNSHICFISEMGDPSTWDKYIKE